MMKECSLCGRNLPHCKCTEFELELYRYLHSPEGKRDLANASKKSKEAIAMLERKRQDIFPVSDLTKRIRERQRQ